jgi:chromosome segregation ATPase
MKPLYLVGIVIAAGLAVVLVIWIVALRGTVTELQAEKAAIESEIATLPRQHTAEVSALKADLERLRTDLARLSRERDDARRTAETEAAEAERLETEHARTVASTVERLTQECEARVEAQMTVIRETKDALEADDGPLAPMLRDTLDRLRELTATAVSR